MMKPMHEAGLDPRYRPGEDPEPLLRALAAGLLGGASVLLLDRLLPTTELAIFDPLLGAAEPLRAGLLWPALLADLLAGDPSAIGLGAAALVIVLSLASFVYVFGQIRRFLPTPPLASGMSWAALLWLLACPSILPRGQAWLASGAAAGASPAGATAIAIWFLLEPLLCLLAYGVVIGWLCQAQDAGAPTREPSGQGME